MTPGSASTDGHSSAAPSSSAWSPADPRVFALSTWLHSRQQEKEPIPSPPGERQGRCAHGFHSCPTSHVATPGRLGGVAFMLHGHNPGESLPRQGEDRH